MPDGVFSMQTTHVSSRGTAGEFEDKLVSEYSLQILVNGRPLYRVVCSPTEPEALVLGRLLSEGLISGIEDVNALQADLAQGFARVELARSLPQAGEQTAAVDSCGGQTLRPAQGAEAALRDGPLPPLSYEREWIFTLARALKRDMPLYTATHGTHSCLLMREGALLHTAEDIGRHNALDKCLGWALQNGVPLSQSLLYTSGRIPVDMVSKAIRAGVPLLASKAMPTRQAVELAQNYRLTLIGAARGDSMVIFS